MNQWKTKKEASVPAEEASDEDIDRLMMERM